MDKDWTYYKSAFLQVLIRMGLCKVITSDQGTEFNNNLNRELMQLLKIDHRLTTAYHPQACVHIDINTFAPCLHVL